MRRNIDVGPEADESQLGPVGRAYRTGVVEICPDISLYTIEEFPLQDHAILCCIQAFVALPVFDPVSNNILGVLGFLWYDISPLQVHQNLDIWLQEVGLKSYYRGSLSGSMHRFKYPKYREINKMFKEVAKTHPLALALASAPCWKEYCLCSSGKGSLHNQVAIYRNHHMNSLDDFIEEYTIYRGIGVSGTAFASGKSCFCGDIRNLSLLNYPYALYARRIGLTFSVATCIKSIQDESSNLLVLEFFLLPSCYCTKCIRLLSRSLLAKIKELLSSYKVADEDFPGEELVANTYDLLKHDEIHCIQVCHNPLSLSVTPNCCDEGCYLATNKEVVDFFFPAKLCYENEERSEDEESSEERSKDEERSSNPLVLWSHDAGKHHGVEEQIKLIFKRLALKFTDLDLIQFWAPRRRADKSFLTISDQPFALGRRIKKVYCLYRKECMRQNIYVDEEEDYEAQLGPAGRAFKNGVGEASPDVRLYTIQEFPLRDYAVLCGIQEVVWLPVFPLDGKDIVGVLEIVRLDVNMYKLKECLGLLAKELKVPLSTSANETNIYGS